MKKWKRYSSVNSQIDFVKRSVGETEFNLEKDRLRVRFGREPNDSDVSWGVLNHLVIKAKGLQLREIYYQMALFLNADGKNCIKVRREGERCELEKYKKDGIKKVKILSGSNSCKECQQQSEKIFTIEEALELKPIPCKSCSYILFPGRPPFCRCLYQAYLDG